MENSNNSNEEYNFRVLIDEMKVRGYSRRTIEAYEYINKTFLSKIRKSPKDIAKNDIIDYLVSLYDKNKASATRHLTCSALKFYYETVLKRRFNLRHPKKSNKLSAVLAKDEILKMIGTSRNPKHRLLIELMYGSGLRVSEAVKIKIEDFDVERKVLLIRSGKGGKDRHANLSERFIEDFIRYAKNKSGYLFESSIRHGMHISARTAESVVKNALRKTGICKRAYCHTLRTSYATHLIENGVDISYVQKLLGHSRLSTTQAYIRLGQDSIRKVKSPLD